MTDQTPESPVQAREFGLTEADIADLDNWFTYHPPAPEQVPVFTAIRDAGHSMAETICALVPPSPDRSAAIRHIREAVMSANASLACYPEGSNRGPR